MENKKIKIPVNVTGEITARFYDQSGLSAFEKWINKIILELRRQFPKLILFYRLGTLVFSDTHKNVICNNGFNAICRRLANDSTFTGTINKMLLGDGVGPAAATDTQLIHETYRNPVASGTASANIAYLTAYFTETECSGTYKEFGNVIDGSAGANTGQLWSHLTNLNWVKGNTVALVVDCKYTFAST